MAKKSEKKKKKEDGDGKPVAKEVETETKLNAGQGEDSQTVKSGTGDAPPIAPDADQQNGGTVNDERSAEGPQTSKSEEEGDSLDTGGSGKTDAFGRSVGVPPNGDKQGDGSDQSLKSRVEKKAAQAGETLSEGDEPPRPDEDKPQGESEPAERAAVNIRLAPATVSAQKTDGLSDEEIAEIVDEINSTFAKTADQGALEVGRFVLKRVFGDSLKDALSHNPKKAESFKKIAEHSDLACDPTNLARWVKAADLVRWLEDKGHKFIYLTCSHYIALLKLRNDSELLVALAQDAEKQKLSVRALKTAIAGPKPPIGVYEMLTKNLGHPGALLEDRQFAILAGNKSVLGELSEYEIKSALDKIESQRERLQEYMSLIMDLDAVLVEVRDEKKRKREELVKSISKQAAAA